MLRKAISDNDGRINDFPVEKQQRKRTRRRKITVQFFFVAVYIFPLSHRKAIACTICDEENGGVLDRNAVIEPIKEYEFINNCGILQDMATLIIKDDSSELCLGFQKSLSNICGCPIDLANESSPCSLCPGGETDLIAGATVSLAPSDVIEVAPELASLVTQFSPTCQLLSAYIRSIPSESEQCSAFLNVKSTATMVSAQQATTCGCDSSCTTDALSVMAGEYSCGDRINWLRNKRGLTEYDACLLVASTEFPEECAPCNPLLNCNNGRNVGVIESTIMYQIQCTCCDGCDIIETETAETIEYNQSGALAGVNKEPCIVCQRNGEIYRALDRDVTKVVNELKLNFLFASTNIFTPTETITCSDVFEILSDLEKDNAFCNKEFLRLFWGYCDCPFHKSMLSCSEVLLPQYCESEGNNFKPDLELPFLADVFRYGGFGGNGFPFEKPTCQEVMWLMNGYWENSATCYAAKHFAYVCGCGIRPYLGTDTRAQQAWLAWLMRLSAFLSFTGSFFIVKDLLSKEKPATRRNRNATNNRGSIRNTRLRSSISIPSEGFTMLQQIIFGMSVFDICSSIAMMFSTLPIPEYERFNHEEMEEGDTISSIPSGVYGAKGNEATCKAQGFFVQLGLTSAFYNMVLSIYYVLVIKYSIRESRLQQFRIWFHIPALIIGFSLAFAGIPFYEDLFVMCVIPPKINYDEEFDTDVLVSNSISAFIQTKTNTLVAIFLLVPITIVFVVGTSSLIIVYCYVWKQERAVKQWRMTPRGSNTRNNNTLSNSVFWQFVFYTLSFLFCWPIYFVANFYTINVWENYGFWVATVIMYPLQGFWNAVVYFRLRLLEKFRKKRQNVRQSAKGKQQQLQRQQAARLNLSGSFNGIAANQIKRDHESASKSELQDNTSNTASTDIQHGQECPSKIDRNLSKKLSQTRIMSITEEGHSLQNDSF